MPRDTAKDEPGRMMIRSYSFKDSESTEFMEPTSPMKPPPDSLALKISGDPKKRILKSPPRIDLQRLKTITGRHEDIAEALFRETGSQTGDQLFEQYQSKRDNMLAIEGKRGIGIIRIIVDHMKDLINADDNNAELTRVVPAVAKEFLECLIIQHPELLKMGQPLEEAAAMVKPVVFLVADLILSKEQLERLPTERCPAKKLDKSDKPSKPCHLSLPSNIRNAFAKTVDKKAGQTCVHDMVKVDELQRWSGNLIKIIEEVVQPTVLHSLIDETSFAADFKTSSFERLLELCKLSTLTTPSDGYYLLHKAALLFKGDSMNFDQVHDIIRSVVRRSPKSIYQLSEVVGESHQTPYALLRSVDPSRNKASNSSQTSTKIEAWKRVEKLLRHTCIGDENDRDEKMEYLYGNLQNARDIYLDMAFPKLIDKDFMETLTAKIDFRFDTALEYVSLRQDENEVSSLNPQVPVKSLITKERNRYQGVFEWLGKRGVEKIFKVVVEDLGATPHTDQAIKAALEDFKVEILDWRKIDLSSQMIAKAAEATRKLFLHSSGNEAVLRSWSCKNGLAKLEQLESVTVTMHPGLREAKDDCEKNFETFKESFRRRRPDIAAKNVCILWAGGPGDAQNVTGTTDLPSSTRQSDQVAWVKNMESFKEYLKNELFTSEDSALANVKIALIDNGVDSTVDDIPHLVPGKSYHGERDKKIPFRDWFTGPSRHGTQMAQCIYQVCPMATLVPIRMDDSKPELDRFTVDSAIKAVRRAYDMDVDIISMSWTFPKEGVTDTQKLEFRTAIEDASRNGRILMGSLNDNEAASNIADFFPLNMSKEVIRIGSATKWEDKADTTRAGHAHYLFPGRDIPFTDPEGDLKNASGSSLATAYASGLAGLIIYAARALPLVDHDLSEKERKDLNEVVKREGVERIFKLLAGSPNKHEPEDLIVKSGSHFPKDAAREAMEYGKAVMLKSFFTKLMTFS
ncbi:hypothetical protein BDV96DRAFT_638522 [Lophiotrema nucula]|uniref:Peptidase S8/S53 domain-containing protein n=1 Tax=Lophiotrema nucula TaxID=690887 RepID=A0A6A5YF26_9PLEO|nr:hypothetical protein BDV96DRAFT_638522 [Lophiotrema nucula]